MVESEFQTFLVLLVVLAGTALLARRLEVAPAILLLLAGTAVAAATHYLIGLRWDVGFLLGAIVSPPDAVAPLAIARKLGIPRRILVVLEGEGLGNDATALILYRFAVAAVATGMFSLPRATGPAVSRWLRTAFSTASSSSGMSNGFKR